jgi:hypothetical protein
MFFNDKEIIVEKLRNPKSIRFIVKKKGIEVVLGD